MSPSGNPSIRLSTRRRSIVLIVVCVAFLFGLSVPVPPSITHGQQPSHSSPAAKTRPRRVETPAAQDDAEEVLRIDTDLVLVDVTVTDVRGRPVRNLRPEDFKLYEDGEARPVSFFNVERRGGIARPLAVVFAVDVSGSMTAEEILRLGGAMQVFTRHLAEREAVFAVMSFGMNAKVVQKFTADAQKLERSFQLIARDLNGLSTHTYDAVDDAIRLIVRAAPRTRERRLMKRAVVVITDGFPVGDTVSPKTVIERANNSEVSVYTVILPSYSRLLASTTDKHAPLPTPLDVSGLVEKTGGTNVYASDKNYESLFKALAEEVTSTYVLAFYPPEANRRDGRYHSIRVEAPRGLNIRQNRAGYKAEGGGQ